MIKSQLVHNNQRFADNMSGVVVLPDDARFARFVLEVPEELETELETYEDIKHQLNDYFDKLLHFIV